MLQGRSLRRVGARLALLAVWLQLILTLGHIHPWDIYLFGHPVVQGQGLTEAAVDRHATPVPIAPLQANAAADQACSICASMALAASAIVADLLKLSPPASATGYAVDYGESILQAASEFLLFQIRAPPIA